MRKLEIVVVAVALLLTRTVLYGVEAAEARKPHNPFGVPDIKDPESKEVQDFAARVKLSGDARDDNAEQWVKNTTAGKRGSIEGTWSDRWRGTGGAWSQGRGPTQIKEIGDRVYILVQASNGKFLIDLKREGNRLIGRYQGIDNPRDTGCCVFLVVSDERIDGNWANIGRWDFRRKLKSPAPYPRIVMAVAEAPDEAGLVPLRLTCVTLEEQTLVREMEKDGSKVTETVITLVPVKRELVVRFTKSTPLQTIGSPQLYGKGLPDYFKEPYPLLVFEGEMSSTSQLPPLRDGSPYLTHVGLISSWKKVVAAKPVPLADEAAALAVKGGWISEEVTVTLNANGKKEKARLLLRLSPDKGKPSGKVTTGMVFGDDKTAAAAEVGMDSFVLVESGGKRAIRIHRPDFRETVTLFYTRDGTKLTVQSGLSLHWAGTRVRLDQTRFEPRK